MRSIIVCVFLLAASAILRAAGTEKTTTPVDEPRYDPATEVSIVAIVTEVREVPHGSPLSGIHLSVKTESQALDAHLGPAEFVKQFEITFAKGDEVRVTGSKVKTANGTRVILVREVRKDAATLSCRRANGEPNWE
ncbi:MAG TPA: hypothetical protein VK335_04820 [Bryobacteraceae bacterium]|nr:hypothetical protein [Bryobacteraceae bacterium]